MHEIWFLIFFLVVIVILVPVSVVLYRKYPVHLIYKSKTDLQDMLDGITDPLAVISSSYKVKRVNKAYIALCDLEFRDTIGKKCYELLRKRITPCPDCKLNDVLKTNKLAVVENSPHPLGNGSISISFSPCNLTNESSCQHIVEHIRDITVLEELKISLEKKNDSLAKTTTILKKAQQNIRDELRLARLIQQDILPKEAPSVEGLQLAVTYHPITDVGGDIYDFIQFTPDRMGIFIGDASGHGLSAALFGTISKMSLYYNTKEEMPVHDLLYKINQDLLDNIHTGHYLTCFWGIFDLKNNTFTYGKAGHPAPVLITKDGKITPLNTMGTFLGLIAGTQFDQNSTSFDNGDRIFLFTDGIYEALDTETRTEMLGYDRFVQILSECNYLPFNKLLSSIQKQLSDYTYDDDYTLIAIETTLPRNAEKTSL